MTHTEQAEDKHYFNSKFPCILYDKNSPVAAHSIPYPDTHICVTDLRDHVTMIWPSATARAALQMLA